MLHSIQELGCVYANRLFEGGEDVLPMLLALLPSTILNFSFFFLGVGIPVLSSIFSAASSSVDE